MKGHGYKNLNALCPFVKGSSSGRLSGGGLGSAGGGAGGVSQGWSGGVLLEGATSVHPGP